MPPPVPKNAKGLAIMLEVEKLGDNPPVDAILSLLHGFNNAGISDAQWRMLLTPPWRRSGEGPGWILRDGANVIGFFGTLRSRLQPRNKAFAFCNLNSWIVKKEYPSGAALLLREALGADDVTFTNMTPSPAVEKIFRGLGFVDLETQVTIMKPATWRFQLSAGDVKIDGSRERFINRLDEAHQWIVNDHGRLTCRQALIQTSRGQCLVVFNVLPLGRFHKAWVYYLSEPAIFAETASVFARWAFVSQGASRVVIESRLLRGQTIRGAESESLVQPRLFRPAEGVGASAVSGLYSELVILNL